jgi:hypothetical protein
MKTLFAALTVLTLGFGTLSAPASANPSLPTSTTTHEGANS